MPLLLTLSIAAALSTCVLLCVLLSLRRRTPGEPPLENGWLPFLGLALQFGVNPLEFLRKRQRQHGDIFTCRIAGKYIHFITDPFSYSAVARRGRHLDWNKFAYELSSKLFGHHSMDPDAGYTTENLHQTFLRTLQGEGLVGMSESMLENMQSVMLRDSDRSKPVLGAEQESPPEMARQRRCRADSAMQPSCAEDATHLLSNPNCVNLIKSDSRGQADRDNVDTPAYKNKGESVSSSSDIQITQHRSAQTDALIRPPQSKPSPLLGHQGLPTAWQQNGLYLFCYSIMFEASFMTMFGKELHQQNSPREHRANINSMQKNFKTFDSFFPALVAGLPIKLFYWAHSAREKLAKELKQEKLYERHNMSALIALRIHLNDTLSRMDDMGKARTHLALLWASLANTLPAAFWSLFYLLRSPEAMQAARKEIKEVVGDCQWKAGELLKFSEEQLNRLVILESVIKEAMRLSSASMNVRVVKEDFELSLDSNRGYRVRKGDDIALYPQLLHYDPDIFHDPLKFKHDRFLGDNGQEKTNFYKNGRKLKYYYMPFGSGITMCPGRFFAMIEMKQFLLLVMSLYDMELLDSEEVPPTLDQARVGLGILQPATDVPFRYRIKPTSRSVHL
uniref:Cytochrome P450, family 7, subfamily A, polypeptide 1 n=1 Tax=Lethenteron reissneri TaxID=7753 RepID=A0A0H5AJG3_LETRI|nr:cytochrome P450, family 7, subfamily A, polypeptide 1 [Lethenteron reissneri]